MNIHPISFFVGWLLQLSGAATVVQMKSFKKGTFKPPRGKELVMCFCMYSDSLPCSSMGDHAYFPGGVCSFLRGRATEG